VRRRKFQVFSGRPAHEEEVDLFSSARGINLRAWLPTVMHNHDVNSGRNRRETAALDAEALTRRRSNRLVKRDVMLGRSARRERTFISIDRDLDLDAEQRQDARR
jgi:hypothetical protein